jgi:hypothetical protein
MRRRTSIEANTQNHSPKKETGKNEELPKAPIELTEEQAKMVAGGVDQLPSEQASLNFSKVKF